MTEEPSGRTFKDRARHYADVLNPLFDCTPFMKSDRFFEFVCALVRAGGAHGPEWDPWYESQATLDDLGNLAKLDLPTAIFPDPNRTRVRLSLLSYCHLTEMDFPYALVANLLRLRLGKKYCMSPFFDLFVPVGKRSAAPLPKLMPPSPGKKIARINKYAEEAKFPEVGQAFKSIYDRVIRNAIYHSDYTLSNGELRLLTDFHLSKDKGHLTPVVEWEQLSELFNDTFAFYTALFSLYERCLKSFAGFKDAFIPFDSHYKGIIQLIFDEDQRLIGFRVYWPNGSLSEYERLKSASSGSNLVFDPDGSINLMVGLYASKPGDFSPLVERDGQPAYPEIPETKIRPFWPENLKPYKLPWTVAVTTTEDPKQDSV
jgi:hypothetical protein